MKHRASPRRIRDSLSIQKVGTETLVYDERFHRAFCLNQSSAIVFQLADGTRSVPEIAAAASLELDAGFNEALVLFALEALREDGLIEPDTSRDDSAQPAPPALSRRALLQRLGTGGALLLPAIAAIVAPTAAQAYSGCFDCSDVESPRSVQATRQTQLARIQRQQQIHSSRNLAPLPEPAGTNPFDLFDLFGPDDPPGAPPK